MSNHGKLRGEVAEALRRWCDDPPCGDTMCEDEQRALLALVELGVRLGIARAADALMACGRGTDNAILAALCWGLASEFRAAKTADILYEKEPSDGR
jgi:hypothetical protein